MSIDLHQCLHNRTRVGCHNAGGSPTVTCTLRVPMASASKLVFSTLTISEVIDYLDPHLFRTSLDVELTSGVVVVMTCVL